MNRLRSDISPGRGLVIVHTGEGKGKTTAALGLLLRAWGHNLNVIMLQFIKRAESVCGEHEAARRMGIEILASGAGFTIKGKNADKNRESSIELWGLAKKAINSKTYRMVILDELTYPLKYGWLPMTEVVEVLRNRPLEVHVIITGRDAPQEIIELADMVTETRQVKHHLRKGIRAQPGIEF
ncbi:MAG: cob(I)yrinic acid a,c-diamide adenosyltransferase [Chloroflexi bacterium]|nr:cob(I)yrinic acid a,c-diamide adenosyltransferase [Chloroflexota bacterium]